MRPGLLGLLILASASRLEGQSIFILDVQGTALDEFPSAVKALNGVMTTVDKNGQRMVMASSPSEFLITLPQVLPAAFTVIVDLVPKACCAPDDIMLEGTPTRNRGVASVELTWQPERISAVGGGGEMYQSAMPDDLAASTPGNLTQLVFEFNGATIKLYTNGRRMYTLDKQFARGRVLRVWLGGESATNPMYLAGLSVLSGAVAQGVIAATAGLPGGGGNTSGQLTSLNQQSNTPLTGNQTQQQTATNQQQLIGPTPTVMRMGPTVTQGSAGPIVQWATLTGANGYTVTRWLSTDLTCCNNASGTLAGSPWQDTPLALAGTYVYEVTASFPTSSSVEQTQFIVVAQVPPRPGTTAGSPPLPTPIPGGTSTATASPPPAISTPAAPAPIAASTGTPVRTSSAPPPGSGAAAALAPTNKPPVGITVSGTPSLAQLNWGSGISGMRGVTYKVDRWLQSNPSCCAAQSATLTFPAWTDEGLQWSGTYVFRITELYPDGTFGVATTTFVRPDPVNPANFRATVSAGSVYLRWDVVPNASWYELTGPGLGLPNFYATTGAYNVHNLTPGTYTWRVGTFYSSPNAPAPVSGPPSAFPTVTVIVP